MLTLPSEETARRLHAYFADNGFTEAGIGKLVGSTSPPLSQNRNLPRFLDLTRAVEPGPVLVRLFFMNVPVEQAAAAVLPEGFRKACLETGLLRLAEGRYEAPMLVVPHEGHYLVADRNPHLHATEATDHVLGFGPSARALLTATITRPVGRLLDLGTGCGVHAFAAASRAETVVATDINPRATACTAFGARLNGLTNV